MDAFGNRIVMKIGNNVRIVEDTQEPWRCWIEVQMDKEGEWISVGNPRMIEIAQEIPEFMKFFFESMS